MTDLYSLCEEITGNFNYIEFATIDFVYNFDDITESVNDPWNSDLDNWDEVYPFGDNKSLEIIEAVSAWEYNDRLSNIKIGVVDTGFSVNTDLEYANASSLTYTANVNNYHGTHVAGIIGAGFNNGKGITGILKNKIYIVMIALMD